MTAVALKQMSLVARNIRQLEYVFTGGVLVIVCLVATYGMRIGRTLREADR